MNEFATGQKVRVACYHCGEDCPPASILHDEKNFCCEGCKTVYDILEGSALGQYYDLENTPGTSQKNQASAEKYAFLDNPEIVKKLLTFDDGNVSKVRFFVPAIHCSSCIWLLENLHRLNKHVLRSEVHFTKKEVNISFRSAELSLRQVAELMGKIGYAPEINLNSGNRKSEKKANRNLSVKVGIAGFCFGNIMLLSLPEYLDVQLDLEHDYKVFFSYLNLLLALPVFFYAGIDYLISAWKGLRHQYINIDVPIALGILTLFGRSAIEILTQTGAGYMDSFTGLIFFLLIGKWYQNKTYQALSFDRDYTSYFPLGATKIIKDTEEANVPVADLKTGDKILVRNQELIPADAVLIKGNGQIDYSFVTGESLPMPKESGDFLYAGGRQMGSAIILEVCKPVESSYLTQLWNQEVFAKPPTRLTSIMDKVSKYFTLIVLGIALCTGIFWAFADPAQIMNAVTSVLIVACPCALALTLPFAFGHTLRYFGKYGLYLKNAETIEQIAKTKDIIFDKTGTITLSSAMEVNFVGDPLHDYELSVIRSVTRQSTHPLSIGIYQSLHENLPLVAIESFEEISGAGMEALINGKRIRLGSSQFVNGKVVDNPNNATRVYVEINGIVKGYFQFQNIYRKGLANIMHQLHAHYQTHLLSGDNEQEKQTLSPYFHHLYFRQSPVDKLNYLKKLEKQGRKTMMIGDGLNDAGALKQSHVGIAIADDVHHFSPACDAILKADSFEKLPQFIKFTSLSMQVVIIAFILSFLYNLIGLSFAVAGLLTPLIAAILMPLSSVTIVGFISLAISYLASKKLS